MILSAILSLSFLGLENKHSSLEFTNMLYILSRQEFVKTVLFCVLTWTWLWNFIMMYFNVYVNSFRKKKRKNFIFDIFVKLLHSRITKTCKIRPVREVWEREIANCEISYTARNVSEANAHDHTFSYSNVFSLVLFP